MNKYFHVFRHLVDFLLLGAIIGTGLLGLLLLKFDRAAQIAVVILMSVFYIFWGMFHHYHDGNLTVKVIAEYILMATLVATILIIFLLKV